MRTISQQFADAIREGEKAKAQNILKEHGYKKTGALMWLSMHTDIDDSWMSILENAQIDENSAGRAILLALADTNNYFSKEKFIQLLLDKTTKEWFEKNDPLHHASFHGNFNAFSILEKKYKELTDNEFDWNKKNVEGHTPLYLSLSETHLNSIVHILKRGGSPHTKIPSNFNSTKEVSVLTRVYNEKSGMLGYVKQIWQSASDKASIEMSIDDNQEINKKKRKVKKM